MSRLDPVFLSIGKVEKEYCGKNKKSKFIMELLYL